MDLPVKLERLNETVESILESNLKTLTTQLSQVQARLQECEKNGTDAVSSIESLTRELAKVGSRVQEVSGDVEQLKTLVKPNPTNNTNSRTEATKLR